MDRRRRGAATQAARRPGLTQAASTVSGPAAPAPSKEAVLRSRLPAQVLVGLLPGFVVQHALLGDVEPDAFRAGLRALLRTRLGSPLPSATPG